MSFDEGVTNTVRQTIIDTTETKPIHVDIVNDEPVEIIAGYVLVAIGEGSNRIVVKQKVRRQKNVGATNSLHQPGALHKEIITWFISMNPRDRFTVETIQINLNGIRQSKKLNAVGFSSVQGRISELLFHKVLFLESKDGKNHYGLDRSRANTVLQEDEF